MGTDEGKFANISQSCFVPSIDYKEGSNGAHIYIYNFPDCSEKCFKNILLALKIFGWDWKRYGASLLRL